MISKNLPSNQNQVYPLDELPPYSQHTEPHVSLKLLTAYEVSMPQSIAVHEESYHLNQQVDQTFDVNNPAVEMIERQTAGFGNSVFQNSSAVNDVNQQLLQDEKKVAINKQEKQAVVVDNVDEKGFKVYDFADKRFRLVKKFVNKIKMFSPTLKFANSTKQQLAKINDPTFQWDILFRQGIFHNEKPSFSERVGHYLDEKAQKIFRIESMASLVITPDSLLSRVWDTIQFITLLINMIFLPILLAFDSFDNSETAFLICELIPNIIQIINMFMEFDTGFYSHGIVISDRTEIFLHYVKGKFIFDFTLNVCWLISLLDGVSTWFKVLGLMRMIVLVYLLGEIEETFSLRESLGSYFELLKLSGFIFMSAHFCGCLWYALGAYEQEIGVKNTWLDKDQDYFTAEEQLSKTFYAYIAAFYWSIVTMCTVGYGDIGPTTYRERIFVIFIVLASSFVFGFSMNQIGQIIQNLRSKEEEMKNTIAILNVYMKKRKLNKEMQLKVRRYYEYIFMHKNEDNEKGRQLIDDLTPCLREEVNRDIYTAMFKNQKMFSLNFTESFLTKLYRIVDERQCRAEEYLYQEGDRSSKLFFILTGQVDLMIGNQLISQISPGTFIGPIEFFTDRVHAFSAKTSQLSQVAVIDRQAFMELIASRREDFETFMQLKDQILQYQDSSSIGHACESCGKHGHIFDNCTLIKFHANKHKQIYEFTSLKQITRQKWPRSTSKVPSLSDNHSVKQGVKLYREEQEIIELDEYEENEEKMSIEKLPIGITISTAALPLVNQQTPTSMLINNLKEMEIGQTTQSRILKNTESQQQVDKSNNHLIPIPIQTQSSPQPLNLLQQNPYDRIASENTDRLPVGKHQLEDQINKKTSSQKARWIDSQSSRNRKLFHRGSASIAAVVGSPAGETGVKIIGGESEFVGSSSVGPVASAKAITSHQMSDQSSKLISGTAFTTKVVVDSLLDIGFERMQEFTKYFVRNNYLQVVYNINKLAEKNSFYQKMLKREKQKKQLSKSASRRKATIKKLSASNNSSSNNKNKIIPNNSNHNSKRNSLKIKGNQGDHSSSDDHNHPLKNRSDLQGTNLKPLLNTQTYQLNLQTGFESKLNGTLF